MVLFVADHRHRRVGAGGGGGGRAASCALGLCAECGYQHEDGDQGEDITTFHDSILTTG